MKKGFLFSYGGNNDMGTIIHTGETYTVDFPKEKEACYGVSFRRNVDLYFEDNAKEVTLEFQSKSKSKFKAILEFKTEKSGGAPEEAFTIKACKGINSFTFPMPKLNSQIKEICFCIFKNDNAKLKTEITILDFSVK